MRTIQNIEVFPIRLPITNTFRCNPRYPNKWFVRNDPYACVSCSFMFDESYTLQPDEALKLAYRVVIGNGEWSRLQIAESFRAAIIAS